jgi:hypothetical protein
MEGEMGGRERKRWRGIEREREVEEEGVRNRERKRERVKEGLRGRESKGEGERVVRVQGRYK